MVKHKFTSEESVAGGRNHGKYDLKLSRAQMRHETHMQEMRILQTLLEAPPIQGIIAIGFVELIKAGVTSMQNMQGQEQNNPLNPLTMFDNTFSGTLQSALGPLGGIILQLGGMKSSSTIGWDVIEGAIAVYIATGGRATEMLSAATGTVSKLLPLLAG